MTVILLDKVIKYILMIYYMISYEPHFNQSLKLYWTDTTGKSIMRSDLEGRNIETFIDGISSSSKHDRMEFPEGVAIDWVARNVYWTDSGKKTIEVAQLDDRRSRSRSIPRVILFDEQIQNPRGIAVHPSARYLADF